MDQPLSGVILAGGKSARLGQDKRRLRLWGPHGPTLLEHTVNLLKEVCDEVVVVLNDADLWPDLGARLEPDHYPSGGSLGGIATGLESVANEAALVIAADMPLVPPALLRWMSEQPRDYDILAPRTAIGTKSGGWETLCAIYTRRCLPTMQAHLVTDNLRIRLVYDQVRVRGLELADVRRFDPAGLAFHNVNTPDDLQMVIDRLSIAGQDDAEYYRRND